MAQPAGEPWIQVVEDMIGHKIRPKQHAIIQKLLQGHHVFGALPTSYGKSVTFGTFPAVYKKMNPGEAAIALIITPLNALSANHVLAWTEKGVSCIQLKPLRDMKEGAVKAIEAGEYSLIFASPEIVHRDHWWDALGKIKNSIRLLVVDEAHCLSRWGGTFRKEYLRVGQLRGILPKAKTLALTATATAELIGQVSLKLGLSNRMFVVSMSPDRPEICLRIESVEENLDDNLAWYADILREKQEEAPRAIIYSRTIASVTKVYYWLDNLLGNKGIIDGVDDEVDGRILEMFHGSTDKGTKERVVTNFRQLGSPLRCVVATIAFGLGVDIPDVQYVLHWGASKDVMAYWQEVGRASRNGQPGQAIAYIYPKSLDAKVEDCMRDVITRSKDKNNCVRRAALRHLDVSPTPGSTQVGQVQQQCCFNCTQKLLSN